jgi:hypothetical protein
MRKPVTAVDRQGRPGARHQAVGRRSVPWIPLDLKDAIVTPMERQLLASRKPRSS